MACDLLDHQADTVKYILSHSVRMLFHKKAVFFVIFAKKIRKTRKGCSNLANYDSWGLTGVAEDFFNNYVSTGHGVTLL